MKIGTSDWWLLLEQALSFHGHRQSGGRRAGTLRTPTASRAPPRRGCRSRSTDARNESGKVARSVLQIVLFFPTVVPNDSKTSIHFASRYPFATPNVGHHLPIMCVFAVDRCLENRHPRFDLTLAATIRQHGRATSPSRNLLGIAVGRWCIARRHAFKTEHVDPAEVAQIGERDAVGKFEGQFKSCQDLSQQCRPRRSGPAIAHHLSPHGSPIGRAINCFVG